MISVCTIYVDFKGANNTWQQGHFRPLSFIGALHNASLEMFNERRRDWEQSQVITDTLRPFFKRVQVPVPAGMVKYPVDYVGFSALRYLSKKKTGGVGTMCSNIEVLDKKGGVCRPLREEEKAEAMKEAEDLYEHDITKVDSQRWGAVGDHEFLSPSVNNPYCSQEEKGFRILPMGIGVVLLYYLAMPPRPTFIYTTDAKHNIICDPALCTNLLWGEEMLPELMARLKTKYGSFVSNQVKYQEGVNETKILS